MKTIQKTHACVWNLIVFFAFLTGMNAAHSAQTEMEPLPKDTLCMGLPWGLGYTTPYLLACNRTIMRTSDPIFGDRAYDFLLRGKIFSTRAEDRTSALDSAKQLGLVPCALLPQQNSKYGVVDILGMAPAEGSDRKQEFCIVQWEGRSDMSSKGGLLACTAGIRLKLSPERMESPQISEDLLTDGFEKLADIHFPFGPNFVIFGRKSPTQN